MAKDTYRINQIIRISKLYYECNMGQVQIAEKEGCTFQAIGKSISAAEKRLKKM